jgi:predicted nucleic acid-binding protein
MGSNSYAANIPFLNSLYSDEHSVRDRIVAARSRTVPVRAVKRQNDKPLLRFFGGEECLGSSICISFLLELRSSYFVIMIVFDASTLILIAKADLLDLFLTSINVPVAIPGEVEKECCSSKKSLDAIIIQKALDESRIEVFTLRNRRLVAKLQKDFSLGRGEAEAIALALDEKAQIVGIDDKNGIDACKVLGIAFTTAVGVLIRGREKGLLEKPDAIAKLALLAKYGRYKHSIIEDARLKLEAKP